jgi:prevent-host-death family protein
MDNILTAAELKRRGMAAIEEGLRNGPVRLVKRNTPTAVVVTEADYRRLTGEASATVPGMTAVQWLLSHPSLGTRSKQEIDAALREERAW